MSTRASRGPWTLKARCPGSASRQRRKTRRAFIGALIKPFRIVVTTLATAIQPAPSPAVQSPLRPSVKIGWARATRTKTTKFAARIALSPQLFCAFRLRPGAFVMC